MSGDGSYERLVKWLEHSGLESPDDIEQASLEDNPDAFARTCIENFVLSCEHATGNDLANFCSDISIFSPQVQETLIEGFCHAYPWYQYRVYCDN